MEYLEKEKTKVYVPVHLVFRQVYEKGEELVKCLEEVRRNSREKFRRGKRKTMKKTMRAYVFPGVENTGDGIKISSKMYLWRSGGNVKITERN